MEKIIDDIPSSVKYAAGGAAVALAMAIFTPAPVLLGIEAAATLGIYLYRRNHKKPASETTVDVTPEEERKEN